MGERQAAGLATELRRRGYAVLPAPREVTLQQGTVQVDDTWGIELDEVDPSDIAVRTLRQRLKDEAGLALEVDAPAERQIRLACEPGAVETGLTDGQDEQAYRIEIDGDGVAVVGNAAPGLFYGVQTLLQLLEGDGRRSLVLPLGTITDWPRYALRILHWDTKHHQDRPETLKRFLDWTARFKANGIAFELEDKFAYPSHPVIGAPGAFTTEELQDLVNYGLERHIQIIPDVQAPAHLAYVLKHEEFAHLRCDGSNYQICMDEPEARKLLFAMYDDVCEATQGVDFLLVSTDEVYYAGICEKFRKPYNPENRSLTWVDYVNAARDHLAGKGRRIIVWMEYPLLKEHRKLLHNDIINGVLRPEMAEEENRLGIRQLCYVPMQGGEHRFPDYFDHVDRDGNHRVGRLRTALDALLRDKAPKGNPIGTFSAAWDDCGLHNETFWLGWAAMAQNSWTPGAAPVEQTVGDFLDCYYGRAVSDMVEVYRDLREGARYWEQAWDRVPAKDKKPLYGNSYAKREMPRRDRTLTPPALPSLPDLAVESTFIEHYPMLIGEAADRLRENDRLLGRLQENLVRATRNRYNLEVFVSLAAFQRHFIELVLGLDGTERLLLKAEEAHEAGKPQRAVGLMVEAHTQVGRLVEDLYANYEAVKTVWEKSRFEKGRSVDGRDFVHVFDDVKDHPADRRPDLTYLIEPEENIGLPAWRTALADIIKQYAAAHDVPVQGLEEIRLED